MASVLLSWGYILQNILEEKYASKSKTHIQLNS